MAERVSISRLCRGCMCELENQVSSCPNCGFDKNNYSVDKKKLRVDSILKGQYLVGNALNGTPYENTYMGWNLNQDSKVVIKELLPSGLVIREDFSTGNVMALSDECGVGFNKVIEEYINKARDFMDNGGKVEILDVFRENGTAYYVMPAKEDDDKYRLMAFTYVDGNTIDEIVGQTRPRKTERTFVQPARSSVKNTNYGSSSQAMSAGTGYMSASKTYIPTPESYISAPEPYIPRGNISAHVIQDNSVEYRPERVLPSLHESNREAQEREKEKELERKIEKRIEERLEKQLEERIEKQMVKSGGAFGVNSDGGRATSQVAPSYGAAVNPDMIKVNVQPDKTLVSATAVPVADEQGVTAGQGMPSNSYRGMISVNGRMVDPNQAMEVGATKKNDKPKLSEIKIAGKSLSTIAGFAICAVVIILVITTLLSKNGDEADANKNGGNSTNAASPKDTTKVEFADTQFEMCVRNALGLSENETITVSYLEDIETLDLSGAGVDDISDISKFTGLKELNLSKNKEIDISVLAQLTSLTKVDLSNCKLKDVSALSSLPNLEYVNLVGNSIEDYTAVDNVKLVNGRFCKFYFTYVYHREDGKYDGYSLWSWHSGTIGGEHTFTEVPDGSVTTTIEYYVPLTEVGFKIKYKDWVDGMDVGYDRWVSLSQNRYEEQITIHIYSDQEKFQIVYSDGTSAEYGVREADKKEK